MFTVKEWHENWMDYAACKGMETNVFFPERQRGAARGREGLGYAAPDYSEALSVCRSCPVRLRCLTYAMEYERTLVENSDVNFIPEHGVFGGKTPEERRKMRRARRTRRRRDEHPAQTIEGEVAFLPSLRLTELPNHQAREAMRDRLGLTR